MTGAVPDALVDSRDLPLYVIVTADGQAHVGGNGTAPADQVAEWLQLLADRAKAKAAAEAASQ